MFKITDFGNKTLSWWYSKRKKIDMNPPYQRRGKLWSDTDKAYLIDSIINGYAPDTPGTYYIMVKVFDGVPALGQCMDGCFISPFHSSDHMGSMLIHFTRYLLPEIFQVI